MSNIKSFTVNNSTASLTIAFSDEASEQEKTIELSFEYLRVFAPTDEKGQPIAATPKVYHKKQVKLVGLESVGKHGYRFIFDDNHSDIYTEAYLYVLGSEYQQRWQQYLESANSAVNSREATIEIKEVR